MKHAPAFLLGALIGSAAMFGYGWALVPPPPPVTHRTAPRPVWTSPAPADADPLETIPPTALPTR